MFKQDTSSTGTQPRGHEVYVKVRDDVRMYALKLTGFRNAFVSRVLIVCHVFEFRVCLFVCVCLFSVVRHTEIDLWQRLQG